jgi:type II secretory pathway component GspD/PulD (secretin)
MSCLHAGAQTKSASPTVESERMVVLQFPNSDVNDLLGIYEKLTGFKIIRDNFVRGKITVFAAEPMTRDEAIQLIERTLFANGYPILQIDPKTVEILGPGRHARGNGVPTIADPKDLPVGERLVSFLFKLKHRNPEKMQRVFAQYLSPPKAYTSFLLVPEANALWVTERTSVIRQFIKMVEEVDIGESIATPTP